MTTTNRRPSARTRNGGAAFEGTPEQQLERAVMATFLWEDQYYETGEQIATRIQNLACEVPQEVAERIAIEARNVHNLRHVGMWVLAARLDRKLPVSADAVAQVLRRADEPGEFLAMYWKDGKRPIPAQAKSGLANAMKRFDAYQLAKYDRSSAMIRPRDVLRLTHPTPDNPEQSENWRKLIAGELETPETWETQLSAGGNKREVFTNLLRENKLGYMALLRNLRNMEQAGVDRALIEDAIRARRGAHNVLPFRFFTAAREAPSFANVIDEALVAQLGEIEPLPGKTAVLVDTSGSMTTVGISAKSTLRAVDAAACLASLVPGDIRTFIFASSAKEIAARKGLAGVDTIRGQIGKVGHGTEIGSSVEYVNRRMPDYDRLIVVTDMQSHDSVGQPLRGKRGYMVNVASNKNGVGFGNNWTHVNGFSESTIKFIRAFEDAQ